MTKAAKKATSKSRDYHLPPGVARQTLLQSAVKLLNERGPGNVSLNDVARDAALNPALVKYYFGSKEHLFEAVIEQIVGEWRAEILAAMPEDAPPEEMLRRRARATMYFLRGYPSLMRLIRRQIMTERSKESRYFIENFMRINFEEQRKILQRGIAEGAFRPVDPVLFFTSYMSTGDLYTFARPILQNVFGLRESDDKLFARFVDHSVDMLLDGIAARKPSRPKR